jgi:hypothetical protein
MVLHDGLENSYNNDIKKQGQQELYKDVFHEGEVPDDGSSTCNHPLEIVELDEKITYA